MLRVQGHNLFQKSMYLTKPCGEFLQYHIHKISYYFDQLVPISVLGDPNCRLINTKYLSTNLNDNRQPRVGTD